MSHLIVWEFRVRPGQEHLFEEVYGPRGAWAALFSRSTEYEGSELVLDTTTPGRYLTLDRWTSAQAFAAFRRLHSGDYEALDARCAGWTEREVCIGAWTAKTANEANAHRPLDSRVHHQLIESLIRNGYAATNEDLQQALGVARSEVDASLRRLHENHGLVLHPGTTDVWIVHPFSLSPTAVSVATATKTWWAPCVWCAMGIVTLLAEDAEIHVRLGGEAESLTISVRDGRLLGRQLLVHFAIPPRDAWKSVIHYCATVLPFRVREDVDAWCARHRLPRGAIIPLETVAELGRVWYGRHRAADWVKWTAKEAAAIFERVGLRGEFWDLPGAEARRF
jgi:hypothetical protein